MSDNNKNLYYLDDLSGYKVASDDSDVRGWEVLDADNRKIGKVDRLLANKETEKVVYLDIEVDQALIEDGHEIYNESANAGAHEFINKEGENHLIIPIGMVKLDKDYKKVISNAINYNTFAKTKRISKSANVDRQYETTVLGQYSSGKTGDQALQNDEDFYNRSEFKKLEDRR